MTDLYTSYDNDIDDDDDDGDSLNFTLNTALAEVKLDLYLCEVKSAVYNVKDDDGEKKRRVIVKLEVDHGPYKGIKATDWLNLDMSRPFNAKKMKNFCESVLGQKLTDDLPITFGPKGADGQRHMEGVEGVLVGVWLKSSEEGFINVDFKGYEPAWDPNAEGLDEEPF